MSGRLSSGLVVHVWNIITLIPRWAARDTGVFRLRRLVRRGLPPDWPGNSRTCRLAVCWNLTWRV